MSWNDINKQIIIEQTKEIFLIPKLSKHDIDFIAIIIDKFNPRDCIIIIMNLHVCIERFSFCLAILLSIITVFVLVDVFLLFTLSL